ncbi:hypothetical protein BS50DRAFT_667099 [Corynespora cassiicola Philippines]|uniref:Uncharacterized protein n=1 Tax=Corynespora cassiicola Philippines TaxID=1448308 RepID=A0A2T2NNC4_CORCC|nr:hypothetical protein BS50DRAFT_667099 [Corynespora cassiicola Philippines]
MNPHRPANGSHCPGYVAYTDQTNRQRTSDSKEEHDIYSSEQRSSGSCFNAPKLAGNPVKPYESVSEQADRIFPSHPNPRPEQGNRTDVSNSHGSTRNDRPGPSDSHGSAPVRRRRAPKEDSTERPLLNSSTSPEYAPGNTAGRNVFSPKAAVKKNFRGPVELNHSGIHARPIGLHAPTFPDKTCRESKPCSPHEDSNYGLIHRVLRKTFCCK